MIQIALKFAEVEFRPGRRITIVNNDVKQGFTIPVSGPRVVNLSLSNSKFRHLHDVRFIPLAH